MILYGFPGSPNTWKVRAFADHIDVPIEFRLTDLTKGEQKSPEFLALNPYGRTPVLVDGDFRLWESNAIMQYLGSRKPNDLWPADDRLRADIMRWQSWQIAHWSKACEPLLFEKIVKAFFNLGAPDPARIAEAEAIFEREGAVLDTHLSKSPYLVAGRLTLADFAVASYLIHHERCRFPVANMPHVQSWMGAVLALPCWRNTAPAG